jgi:hypothetical protein
MLGGVDDSKRALSAFVRSAIGGFVKDGTPGGGAHWPRFTSDAPGLLQVNSRLRPGQLT